MPEQLPFELVLNIFGNLEYGDIIRLSRTCKMFSQVANSELLWEHLCLRDYDVKIEPKLRHEDSRKSSKLFYFKLLLPHGPKLGLWQRQVLSYGSLHQIVYDDDYGLEMLQWFPPKSEIVLASLVPYKFMTFSMDWETGEVVTRLWDDFALKELDTTTKLFKEFGFEIDNDLHGGEDDFEINLNPAEVCGLNINQDLLFCKMKRFLERETGSRNATPNVVLPRLQILKFETMLTRTSYRFKRLKLERSLDQHSRFPIEPGVFKGTYGPHGIELLDVHYDDSDNNNFVAIKITGDPNVPSRQISFKTELSNNFLRFLTKEQQLSLDTLINVEKTSEDWTKSELLPFYVPSEVMNRGDNEDMDANRIKFSRYRFFCQCQVAGHGFLGPEYINGHLVIFDSDLFAVIFLELQSISFFHRVKENLFCKSRHQLNIKEIMVPAQTISLTSV